MDKEEERSWREFFAASARRTWVKFPRGVIATLEAIMEFQGRTDEEKFDLMQWAMEEYRSALKEASSNAEGMPD